MYQYSNMALRVKGQNSNFSKFLLFLNSQKRIGYKGNNNKNIEACPDRKFRSHHTCMTWYIIIIKHGLSERELKILAFQTHHGSYLAFPTRTHTQYNMWHLHEYTNEYTE